MNLKVKLKLMNLSDLRFVCRELGISCPKTKKSIIKKLLEPLNKNYKMEIEMEPLKDIVERKEKRKKKKADLFKLRKIVQYMRKKTTISNEMRKNLLKRLKALQEISDQQEIDEFPWDNFYKAFITFYSNFNTKSKNKIIKKLNEAIFDNKMYIVMYGNKNIYNQKNKALKALVKKLKNEDK